MIVRCFVCCKNLSQTDSQSQIISLFDFVLVSLVFETSSLALSPRFAFAHGLITLVILSARFRLLIPNFARNAHLEITIASFATPSKSALCSGLFSCCLHGLGGDHLHCVSPHAGGVSLVRASWVEFLLSRQVGITRRAPHCSFVSYPSRTPSPSAR